MPDIKSLPRNVFIFLTGIATQLFTSTNIVPSTSIEIPVQLAIASASRFAKKTANVVSKCFHDRNTVPFILVGKKTLKVHWSAIECYNTISTRRTTFKELTEIANAAACFTGFLHHRLLRSEENDNCEWLVDEINEMLETYNEEKALAINEHQNLSPERAKRIMEDLFKLNTFGKYIKETHDKEMNKLYSDEIYLPRLVEITLVTD
ncbi:hypothetical protein DdX_21350 [Ditylenchus destructor]|uniref:Uncharacterized protein n=1 Tax=Ditylenchus destructor TaxID=166010 RepID=A0AAD4MHG6_9BILA|nr:hypothetical protein DdX_21350 [Ditylenchus destructor]